MASTQTISAAEFNLFQDVYCIYLALFCWDWRGDLKQTAAAMLRDSERRL